MNISTVVNILFVLMAILLMGAFLGMNVLAVLITMLLMGIFLGLFFVAISLLVKHRLNDIRLSTSIVSIFSFIWLLNIVEELFLAIKASFYSGFSYVEADRLGITSWAWWICIIIFLIFYHEHEEVFVKKWKAISTKIEEFLTGSDLQ